ncbi:DUF2848 domain-containing protein [Stappia sp. TSB10P1A]|uniref:DUF2848 domain-containing protein n=1 Tax=Stappia sp. TSB10P1A TaxID=2003585 RepID=UPI001643A0EC|nr:DUF2848 domain-containing protein [Stappia sp. TSB10P1A]
MEFTLNGAPLVVHVADLTVAGWTGRDPEAIRHHIEELAEIGVAPPSTVPLYYRTAAALLTQENRIQVVGGGTSGEVEPFLLAKDGVLHIGLASDHTDRDLEAHSVALSKQACAKPVARELWLFEEVAGHLDALELRSWIKEDAAGDWIPYQDGKVGSIRPLADLIEGSGLDVARERGDCTAMLCGTLGAIGGVRPAAAFRMELRDPVLGRSIGHSYDITVLPIVA